MIHRAEQGRPKQLRFRLGKDLSLVLVKEGLARNPRPVAPKSSSGKRGATTDSKSGSDLVSAAGFEPATHALKEYGHLGTGS